MRCWGSKGEVRNGYIIRRKVRFFTGVHKGLLGVHMLIWVRVLGHWVRGFPHERAYSCDGSFWGALVGRCWSGEPF
jgi:hypothetical protein